MKNLLPISKGAHGQPHAPKQKNGMSKKRDRIDLNPAPSPLGNPFAHLHSEGLPAAPAQESQARPSQSEASKPAKLGRVVLRRETAHRGGKTVTIIYDLAPHLGAACIESLGRKLKTACGCGGTVKGREIEIQGEQVAKIRALLEQEGFRVAGVT